VPTTLRVLIIEDSQDDALLLVRELERAGYKVAFERVETPDGMKRALDEKEWDVIISDYRMPRFSGLAALEITRKRGLDLPFIVVSGTIGEDTAVDTMKAGASDYVMKANLTRLAPAIERELGETRMRRARNRAEEELKISEEKYRTIIENVRDIIYTVSHDGIVTYVSPNVTYLGYKPEDIIGHRITDFIHSDDMERVLLDFDKMMHGNAEFITEFRLLKKDGSFIYAEEVSKAVREDGKITHLIGVIRDMTERKRIELEIAAWKQRYELIVSFSGQLVYDYDIPTGRIIWGGSIERVLGYFPGEMADDIDQWTEHIHPDDREEAMRLLKVAQDAGSIYETIYRFRRKDGGYIWMHDLGSFIKDTSGRAVRMLGMMADITEAKKSNDRLLSINRCFTSFTANVIENINRLASLCGELLGGDYALYNRIEAGLLCSIGRWHEPEDYDPVDKPEGHICYDVIQKGGEAVTAIRSLDQTIYKETDPNVRKYGLKTYIGRAVKCGNMSAGSLSVVYRKDYIPSEDDKKIMNIIASAIGIEEARRQAEQNLTVQRDMAQRYLDISEAIFVVIDADQRVSLINKKGCQILGYTEEEVIGANWFDTFLPEQNRQEQKKNFIMVINKDLDIRAAEHVEAMILTKSGAERILVWHNTLVLDTEGKITAMLGAGHDITEYRDMERELQKRLEDLEKFNRLVVGREMKMIELKKRVSELEEKLKAAGEGGAQQA
jgi:PAS domain S-box-containing protein